MKTKVKRNKPNRVKLHNVEPAGLTNALNEPTLNLSRRAIRQLSQFFAEDARICQDYEFRYMEQRTNY